MHVYILRIIDIVYSISPSFAKKNEIVQEFLKSWNQGDLHNLIALMAENITFWSDGGGQVTAARHPLYGCQKVARFLIAIRRSRLIPIFNPTILQINGQPGILNTVREKPQSTFSFEFSDQKIESIFAVVNPDKLTSVKLKAYNIVL